MRDLQPLLLEAVALLLRSEHRWVTIAHANPISTCGIDTKLDKRCSDRCAERGRRLTKILVEVAASGCTPELHSHLAGVSPSDESAEADDKREEAEKLLGQLFPHYEAELLAAFQAARQGGPHA